MPRQKAGNEQIRKLQKTGQNGTTYMVTLPLNLINDLGWQKKQKVVVEKHGNTLVIKDWQN